MAPISEALLWGQQLHILLPFRIKAPEIYILIPLYLQAILVWERRPPHGCTGRFYDVHLNFTPSATGTRNGSLSFIDNDISESPYNFSLRGNGFDNISPTIISNGDGTNAAGCVFG